MKNDNYTENLNLSRRDSDMIDEDNVLSPTSMSVAGDKDEEPEKSSLDLLKELEDNYVEYKAPTEKESQYGDSSNSSEAKQTAAQTAAQKQKASGFVVGANIRTNNERFMFLYKEAIKEFRIP